MNLHQFHYLIKTINFYIIQDQYLLSRLYTRFFLFLSYNVLNLVTNKYDQYKKKTKNK